MREDLIKMPNIGPVVASQLFNAGIRSPEDLKAAGSREAWLKIKAKDPSACLNRLCALEGAIQNIRWHNLSVETKTALKAFYLMHK